MKYILIQTAAALLLFLTWPFFVALSAFLLLYVVINKTVKAFFKLLEPVPGEYEISGWQTE